MCRSMTVTVQLKLFKGPDLLLLMFEKSKGSTYTFLPPTGGRANYWPPARRPAPKMVKTGGGDSLCKRDTYDRPMIF